jgi:hypothetical protein
MLTHEQKTYNKNSKKAGNRQSGLCRDTASYGWLYPLYTPRADGNSKFMEAVHILPRFLLSELSGHQRLGG